MCLKVLFLFVLFAIMSMTQDKLENLSTCACDGFSVLVGKRKGLIWGYKEEEKERFLWCSGVV